MDIRINDNVINIGLNVDDKQIDFEEEREPYTGSYNVTPTDEEQVLETARKRMLDNVKVEEVPFYMTSTPNTNGATVSIG